MRGLARRLSETLIAFCVMFAAGDAMAAGLPGVDATRLCTGHFPNPITDTCWTCMFPLTLGGATLFKGKGHADTPNPPSPICLCDKPIPRIGLEVGFWEPVRLADVTPRAWCFVNLGGKSISPGFGYPAKTRDMQRPGSYSGYHVHWYIYPLMYWMEILTDFLCLEQASFDIAYITELDPLWQSDRLSLLINPEVVLFANPIAIAACTVDCAAASVGLPIKQLFWCAGCHGSMYPLNGTSVGEHGTLDGSLHVLEKFTYKLHRQLIAWGTMGSKALCQKYPMPILDKRQYRYQLVNPKSIISGPATCPPTGATTIPYEAGKVIPVAGEDMGFLVWRKRNCCAGPPL